MDGEVLISKILFSQNAHLHDTVYSEMLVKNNYVSKRPLHVDLYVYPYSTCVARRCKPVCV
jgi:hypothetical protein